MQEKIDALYLSADFKYDIGPVGLRGNVGVRADRTATSYALVNAAGTLTPVTIEHKYRNYLPALNLTAQLPKDVYLLLLLGGGCSITDGAPACC